MVLSIFDCALCMKIVIIPSPNKYFSNLQGDCHYLCEGKVPNFLTE
jgi:hypothetical protein